MGKMKLLKGHAKKIVFKLLEHVSSATPLSVKLPRAASREALQKRKMFSDLWV